LKSDKPSLAKFFKFKGIQSASLVEEVATCLFFAAFGSLFILMAG
jgi:hypothetical protein